MSLEFSFLLFFLSVKNNNEFFVINFSIFILTLDYIPAVIKTI